MKKIAFTVAAALVFFSFSFAAAQDAAVRNWFPERNDKEVRAILMEHSELKDPSSVQIRKLMVETDEKCVRWCGEINAKNSYGAYVGFYPLFVGKFHDGTYVILIDKEEDKRGGYASILCSSVYKNRFNK